MTDAPIINYCAKQRPTIWHRLGFGWCGGPDMDDLEEAEGFAPAYIEIETQIFLDWRDRLRAFVSGKLVVISRTKTEHTNKRVLTRASVGVLPPDHRNERAR